MVQESHGGRRLGAARSRAGAMPRHEPSLAVFPHRHFLEMFVRLHSAIEGGALHRAQNLEAGISGPPFPLRTRRLGHEPDDHSDRGGRR